jgi:hypothetical protein
MQVTAPPDTELESFCFEQSVLEFHDDKYEEEE